MIEFQQIKPSPRDDRDYIAAPTANQLFSHVDLLPDVEEVENQFISGTCTANAAASALEIAYKRDGQSKDFSRLYNYWYSRLLGGITGDNGAYPRDVCKALNKYGICLESTWEFDLEKNLNVEPSIEAQIEAKDYPVYEYARLYSEDVALDIKKSVASGIPVMTSIKTSAAFNFLRGDWKTHDWDPSVDFTGAHQVLIIGYNDEAQRFLGMNSWGNRWGDGGFFGIPYNRVGTDYYEKNTAAYEYWVLTKIGVPYREADGRETDPYNVVEEEIKEQNEKSRKIEVGMILGFLVAAAAMLAIFKL